MRGPPGRRRSLPEVLGEPAQDDADDLAESGRRAMARSGDEMDLGAGPALEDQGVGLGGRARRRHQAELVSAFGLP